MYSAHPTIQPTTQRNTNHILQQTRYATATHQEQSKKPLHIYTQSTKKEAPFPSPKRSNRKVKKIEGEKKKKRSQGCVSV